MRLDVGSGLHPKMHSIVPLKDGIVRVTHLDHVSMLDCSTTPKLARILAQFYARYENAAVAASIDAVRSAQYTATKAKLAQTLQMLRDTEKKFSELMKRMKRVQSLDPESSLEDLARLLFGEKKASKILRGLNMKSSFARTGPRGNCFLSSAKPSKHGSIYRAGCFVSVVFKQIMEFVTCAETAEGEGSRVLALVWSAFLSSPAVKKMSILGAPSKDSKFSSNCLQAVRVALCQCQAIYKTTKLPKYRFLHKQILSIVCYCGTRSEVANLLSTEENKISVNAVAVARRHAERAFGGAEAKQKTYSLNRTDRETVLHMRG